MFLNHELLSIVMTRIKLETSLIIPKNFTMDSVEEAGLVVFRLVTNEFMQGWSKV